MIINTGGRTDTVQYFSKWLLNRFREGYVLSRNPFCPKKVARYELNPDVVDCVIFCSKNYEPILDNLEEITNKFNTYFHYTITAYGKDIEPFVPSVDESINTLLKLEKIVGKNRIAWRYDPVLLTSKYTVEYHIETFKYMTQRLFKHIDRCIFSFVEMYKKLENNMPEIILLNDDDKVCLLKKFGEIAKKYDIKIQTCGTDDNYEKYGIMCSGCMTLDILGGANDIEFKKMKQGGLRQGCHCVETRDIGAYDTCLNGCRYCYANKNPKAAKENFKFHNPNSPLLLGEIEEDDVIYAANQKSFLKEYKQINLF